ncbi:MAG: malto-oligosyltrehalose trehalohydrolase [Bdellovibrionales bacterium]
MITRKFPIGAEVRAEGGVHFRIWAPRSRGLNLVLGHADTRNRIRAMKPEREGYFSLYAADVKAGDLYGFQLEGDDAVLPDPASRSQPEGPMDLSQVVDPSTFKWGDQDWRGLGLRGQVIYEMHIGTFTPEGTWNAATKQLPMLKDLGVTTIEMMPIAEFPGNFGWGYDGVDLFAPYHIYGTPDDLRRFINKAHELQLGVILDVVYNHFGPSGNFLARFSESYFSDRYKNEWGDPINFDGPASGPVREFFITNARYWIEEFHFDGLRLDATQSIFDASERHVLAQISQACHEAAGERSVLLVAENEPQESRTVTPVEQGGYGLDMMWNDDFHHAFRVALTGKREAYYGDYRGTADELALVTKWGFLYQGQHNARQGKRRGSPALHLPAFRLVSYLQNHDQIANSARGDRLQFHTSPGRLRAATAALLLLPFTPMLFQGQEFGASNPFLYFAHHQDDLAQMVAKGRREFLMQFPSMTAMEKSCRFTTPDDPETFASSRLKWNEREHERHATLYQLHKDLLRLRREDPVLRRQDAQQMTVCILGPAALAWRYFGQDEGDRLLIVSLGMDLNASDVHPNPLLVPPQGHDWRLVVSTELPDYGGCGVAPPDAHGQWNYLGSSAYFFASHPV